MLAAILTIAICGSIGVTGFDGVLEPPDKTIYDHDSGVMWEQLDKDHKGEISISAIPKNISAHLHLASTSYEDAVKQMDSSADGLIQEEEFLTYCDPKISRIWGKLEFSHADYDNSTTLNMTEFEASAYAMVNAPPPKDDDTHHHNDQVMQPLFDKMDTSRDGLISESEYVAMSIDPFTLMDTDGNGKVDRDEWMASGKKYEQAEEDSSSEFESADMDKDKFITRTEYRKFGSDLNPKDEEGLGSDALEGESESESDDSGSAHDEI